MTTAEHIRKILDACACACATHERLGRVRVIYYDGRSCCTIISQGRQLTVDVARLSAVTTPNDERDLQKRQRRAERELDRGAVAGLIRSSRRP
jgi:hypothetical protein